VADIEWVQNFMYLRAKTIFGGSNEVQKNVVAKHLFGM
jgi:alkylation response protein AidB-like acyl-CoA dehydrogenase